MRAPTGYQSSTDIGIIGIRPPTAPGPAHHHTGAPAEECPIITDIDPALLNPGALHALLRRTGNVYSAHLNEVVDQLLMDGRTTTPTARVRLVGFGSHGRIPRGITNHLGDAARFIRRHLASCQDLYRVTRFSDPVLALLGLLDMVT